MIMSDRGDHESNARALMSGRLYTFLDQYRKYYSRAGIDLIGLFTDILQRTPSI
jgi:hypothetical protein